MTKKIHTHRGHCQLCASIQAIDVNTGIIAKHGYTKDRGYFSGVCPGSDHMNLHVERKLADQHISAARQEARDKRAQASRYASKAEHPGYVWNGSYKMAKDHMAFLMGDGIGCRSSRACAEYSKLKEVEITVAWVDATPEYQEIGRKRAMEALITRAEDCEDYANKLEVWANRITGKVDPYQLKDLEPREHKVGDTVRIGGKMGYSAVVEALEERDYTTYGWRKGRNTVKCMHMRVTQPAVTEKRTKGEYSYVTREARDAKVVWVACRDVPRAPNPLAEELKKAGLL